ncbi:hypothetical protein GCM10010319_46310 [Streptomyces blastmyceticus]|uniref:Secreted protein n=1 Tax=Streptomyces blastmyceticus TaxID=68180 RepID=A0ABP3H6D8_9ACTN
MVTIPARLMTGGSGVLSAYSMIRALIRASVVLAILSRCATRERASSTKSFMAISRLRGRSAGQEPEFRARCAGYGAAAGYRRRYGGGMAFDGVPWRVLKIDPFGRHRIGGVR